MSELFDLEVEDAPDADTVSAERSQSFASFDCPTWR
jgi:hypothetical protein